MVKKKGLERMGGIESVGWLVEAYADEDYDDMIGWRRGG